jgi:RND family efflux transporter MFP subunit
MPPFKPPEVRVGNAVVRKVTEYEEFTGRTAAIETVEIRAHVSGYLDAVHFTEGGEVKKGDLLLEIDPRPFIAELNRTEALLEQADAHHKRLEADYRRAQEMLLNKSIGREEFDRIAGDRLEGRAAVGSALAARDMAKLNLEFSRVKAPTSGRISRRWVDPGNMIKLDETPLTLIVSQDPIYALFDVDERTYRRIRRYLEQSKAWAPLAANTVSLIAQTQSRPLSAAGPAPYVLGVSRTARLIVPVYLGLADDEGFPHRGLVNFVDNRVDPDSVSVWVRGIFPNKDRQLAPGQFVRVRLPVGEPKEAVVIPERALATDQGQKFVFVVEKNAEGQDVASYRRVEVGEQHGAYRVIKPPKDKSVKGVEPNDRVILSGLQRVKNGGPVVVQGVEEDPPEDLDKTDDKTAGEH